MPPTSTGGATADDSSVTKYCHGNLKGVTYGQSSNKTDSREPRPKPPQLHPCRRIRHADASSIRRGTNKPRQNTLADIYENGASFRCVRGFCARSCRSTNYGEEGNHPLRDPLHFPTADEH